MKKKFWFLCFLLLLLFSFLLRLVPAQNHNFYFTEDQGKDALWIREILEQKHLVLRGPETSIPGVSAGPLWYYFQALGYFLFRGDPLGGVFVLVALNTLLLGILVWRFKKEVGGPASLTVGFFLSFFWWFYDTSRWAFNPFPLVFFAFLTIFFLLDFLKGSLKGYFWALVMVFLAFNTDVAAAAALWIFCVLIGLYGVLKQKASFQIWLVFSFLIPAVATFNILFEALKVFLRTRLIIGEVGKGLGVFAGTAFSQVIPRFLEILSYAVVPYQVGLGSLIFLVLFFVFLKREKNDFVKKFVILVLCLFLVSLLFFSSTRGWRDWHTVYLPSLLFVSFLSMLWILPLKWRLFALTGVFVLQFGVFRERYLQYLKPSDDPGLLANKIAAVDWIYQKSENDGFNVYVYNGRDYDYTYQYLFWWWGGRSYGFMPCEYADHPGSLKLYVPNRDFYGKPTLGCDRLRFLVIGVQDERTQDWLFKVEKGLELIERDVVGGIEVRKLKKV